LINQRARAAAQDPSRKDAKTLMRSDVKKATGLPGEFPPQYAKDFSPEEKQAHIEAIDRALGSAQHQRDLAEAGIKPKLDDKTHKLTAVPVGTKTQKLTASEDVSEPVILNRGTVAPPVTNGTPSTVRGHMDRDSGKVLGNLMNKLNKLKRS
jgi:hypothetical protein